MDGLTSPDGSFQDVSFAVHAGEIFGIAGIVGAGGARNWFARSRGADPVSSGSIAVDGRARQHQETKRRDRRGFGSGWCPRTGKAQGGCSTGPYRRDQSGAR